MSGLFHPAAYDTGRRVDSHWEASAGPPPEGCPPLSGEERCDVAIVGGGYTGLSAALHLARDGQLDVRVLEAGPPGWGASGRNGGFCCIGATKLSDAALLRRYGRDETRYFYRTQRDAIALVASLVDAEGIRCDRQGAGVIQVAHTPRRARRLAEAARFSNQVLDLPATAWSRAELAEQAYAGPEAFGALAYRNGFGLHPLKYHYGLLAAALRHGARLHALSRVTRWEKDGGGHRLHTAGGSLRADRVILATNGYTDEGLQPALAGTLLPAVSNIIVTRPLTADEWAAQGWHTDNPISDSRNLLFYFRRLSCGRFLLGSRGDTSASPESGARMRAWMERRLGEMFPAWKGVEIERFWTGLICLSANRSALAGSLPDDPSVLYGLAYHGNGVASGSWTGWALAQRLLGRDNRPGARLPAPLAERPRRFPLPGLRLWYLRAAYAGLRLADLR